MSLLSLDAGGANHPCLAWVAEILGVARKWRENSGSRLLDPWRRVVIARRATDAEHHFIPRRQDFRVPSPERTRRRFQLRVPSSQHDPTLWPVVGGHVNTTPR
jgi:hypothetical protein